jgi:hypothetical protein
MQIKIKDNFKEVVKNFNRLEKKQLPFASMNSINKVMSMMKPYFKLVTRKVFNSPTPFTQNAFHFFKANLKSMRGVFFIKSAQEEYLRYQIDGGIRSTGKKIPVPFYNARLNKYGNIIGKRTGLLKKRTQFIAEIKGVSGVYERQKKGPPKLLYSFHDSVEYKTRFNFFKIGRKFIDKHLPKILKREVRKAMRR